MTWPFSAPHRHTHTRTHTHAPSLLHLCGCTHTHMHMHSEAWHAPADETIVLSSVRGLAGVSHTSEAQVKHSRFQFVYCLHLRFSSVNPPAKKKTFTAGARLETGGGQLEIESFFPAGGSSEIKYMRVVVGMPQILQASSPSKTRRAQRSSCRRREWRGEREGERESGSGDEKKEEGWGRGRRREQEGGGQLRRK